MATNKRRRVFATNQKTPWDDLAFKLHFGWGDTGRSFLTNDGRPGTLKLVRDDDQDGTMHLKVDMGASEIGPGWDDTRFDFIDGHTLTLGHKFPEWADNATIGGDWVLQGEEIIAMMKNPALKLAIIEGTYDRQYPVYGIFLPRSVLISGGRLSDIFLFVIVFGSSPDGGATGPPPPP